MNVHLNPNWLVWGFVALTAVSAVNIGVQANSYLTLYSSIGRLQFALSGVFLRNDTFTGPNVSVQLNATNPTDYSGLQLSKVSFMTYFVAGNSTLFGSPPILNAMNVGKPLAAHSSLVWTIVTPIDARGAALISSFKNDHGGDVIAPTQVAVLVSSPFLDATGNQAEYRLVQNLTLT
ncbi:MAG TPA: hypothetical protein VFE98_03800 [Candidatus Bathyarchaeia archaeon]|nr:hypothetical protein [Candidatus Bathyarchaeia archaeon]